MFHSTLRRRIISFTQTSVEILIDVLDATTRLTTVEGDVAEQDDRLTIIESSVDLLDDRIIALEVADIDINERLTTLEETILSMYELRASETLLYQYQI